MWDFDGVMIYESLIKDVFISLWAKSVETELNKDERIVGIKSHCEKGQACQWSFQFVIGRMCYE
jgi:hypothetical protein